MLANKNISPRNLGSGPSLCQALFLRNNENWASLSPIWTTCSAVKKAALQRGEGGEKNKEGRRIRGGKRRRGERRRKMSLTYRETDIRAQVAIGRRRQEKKRNSEDSGFLSSC